MIDGVKILCNTSASHWLSNENLTFHTTVNETTGEILSTKRYAVKNGLRFELVQSAVSPKVHTLCKGSLATFYNNGLHNGFDYDFNAFAQTLNIIQNQYAIVPADAVLQGFEFGVNITLPIPVKEFLRCLKHCKATSFAMLKISGVIVGLQLPMQRYTLKVYDKGLQLNQSDSNILRFELSINKMVYVQGLNIKTLANLLSVNIWVQLGKMLLQFWSDTVYIPKKVPIKTMPNQTQKKFLRYLDADYWNDLTKSQRYKSIKHLNQILTLYSTDTTKQNIMNLMTEKAIKLATANGDLLTNFTTPKKLPKIKPVWRPFNRLDKGLKGNQTNPILTNNLHIKKTVQKPCFFAHKKTAFCLTCNASLTHKKTGAKFCCSKCKSKALSNLRKQKRGETKHNEKMLLQRLLKYLHKQKYWLKITYTKIKIRGFEGYTFTDCLHQSEIHAPKSWLKSITRVDIKNIGTPLTSYRAKQFIKAITHLNLK